MSRRLSSNAVRIFFLLTIVTFASAPCFGQQIIRGVDEPQNPEPSNVWLPFGFYTDPTQLAFGVGGVTTGTYQPQLFFGAAAFMSFNGSTGFYFINHDLRLGDDSRLFLDSKIGFTRFAKNQEYVDGNPNFPNQVAGSNGSSRDDFVVSDTYNTFGEFPLKYVLPIGSATESPIARYSMDRGILKDGATGGWDFNPMTSGRTFVILTPFVDNRELHPETPIQQTSYNTNGLRLALKWDNSDFPLNPSRGNVAEVQLSRDFGMLKSSGQYTTLEASYAQFLSMGRNSWFKQQVLALYGWTVATTAGETPYFTGATLGGYDRMRAFNFNRYHGNDALMVSAEYRMMPDWNPIDALGVNKIARVDWVQFVAFGEVGRVADSYSTELFEDPRWDAGLGIRALSRKVVLRADWAYSPEGSTFWVMVGQSF